ncbi:MAG: metalloregulator ArsR/SmtB family transcription factor [Candidatus Competibacteraceae bacterium]
MEKTDAVIALDALAQETRLDIFRYLVQLGSAGAPAGHIAQALGLPNATLSFHIKTLQHAGLVERKRQSRSLIYAANFAQMNSLLIYLTENCCAGEADHCATLCEHDRMHPTAAPAVVTNNGVEKAKRLRR